MQAVVSTPVDRLHASDEVRVLKEENAALEAQMLADRKAYDKMTEDMHLALQSVIADRTDCQKILNELQHALETSKTTVAASEQKHAAEMRPTIEEHDRVNRVKSAALDAVEERVVQLDARNEKVAAQALADAETHAAEMHATVEAREAVIRDKTAALDAVVREKRDLNERVLQLDVRNAQLLAQTVDDAKTHAIKCSLIADELRSAHADHAVHVVEAKVELDAVAERLRQTTADCSRARRRARVPNGDLVANR